MYVSQDFIGGRTFGVGREYMNRKFTTQVFTEIEYKRRFPVTVPSWKGGGHHQNPWPKACHSRSVLVNIRLVICSEINPIRKINTEVIKSRALMLVNLPSYM